MSMVYVIVYLTTGLSFFFLLVTFLSPVYFIGSFILLGCIFALLFILVIHIVLNYSYEEIFFYSYIKSKAKGVYIFLLFFQWFSLFYVNVYQFYLLYILISYRFIVVDWLIACLIVHFLSLFIFFVKFFVFMVNWHWIELRWVCCCFL